MASITAELFSTGKYSDLLIKCKGKEFRVHRAVVCLQSKPLAAAVDGQFKEAITGEIDLDGNEPDIVECMLKFMYNQDYTDGRGSDVKIVANRPTKKAKKSQTSLSSSAATTATANLADSTTTLDSLMTNTKVYIIGDQLQIQGLKTLAKKKYEEVVSDKWNTTSFVASLKLLYEETMDSDRLLKDVAIKTAQEHTKDLSDREDFAALCKETGEIAFDILKASVSPEMMTRVKKCDHCSDDSSVLRLYNNYPDGWFYCTECGSFPD